MALNAREERWNPRPEKGLKKVLRESEQALEEESESGQLIYTSPLSYKARAAHR